MQSPEDLENTPFKAELYIPLSKFRPFGDAVRNFLDSRWISLK